MAVNQSFHFPTPKKRASVAMTVSYTHLEHGRAVHLRLGKRRRDIFPERERFDNMYAHFHRQRRGKLHHVLLAVGRIYCGCALHVARAALGICGRIGHDAAAPVSYTHLENFLIARACAAMKSAAFS